MNKRGLIVFSISVSKEKEKELDENLKRLQKIGYPKVGDKLIAIKSGNTLVERSENGHEIGEFHVTKDKTYEVINNLDFCNGYLHVQADDYGCVLLSPEILEEFFGLKLRKVTK